MKWPEIIYSGIYSDFWIMQKSWIVQIKFFWKKLYNHDLSKLCNLSWGVKIMSHLIELTFKCWMRISSKRHIQHTTIKFLIPFLINSGHDIFSFIKMIHISLSMFDKCILRNTTKEWLYNDTEILSKYWLLHHI